MDTDLVLRAEGGGQEPFADLVYADAHRFLSVGHRILSDIDLTKDATQQARCSASGRTFRGSATPPASRPRPRRFAGSTAC
ncbi:MAG TPA: hypothetical protein VFM19_08075 [Candidatus Limnocylindria bacterium]|nr:hypothetical protein [Candidatus Limnocylindria bacterium]